MPVQAAPVGAKFSGLNLKAWVLFTGATGAILKSSNTASLVRDAAGSFTWTFTNAMDSANYSFTGSFDEYSATTNPSYMSISSVAAGSCVIGPVLSGNGFDPAVCYVAIYE